MNANATYGALPGVGLVGLENAHEATDNGTHAFVERRYRLASAVGWLMSAPHMTVVAGRSLRVPRQQGIDMAPRPVS